MKIPIFLNPSLLKQALTHRSAVNEGHGENHNERLEFLGDAVIELIASEWLFKRFPLKTEGELTAARTALVRTETLAARAQNLEIPEQIIMSRGEQRAGGQRNPSLLADTFEAVTGALYLDQGISTTRVFLQDALLSDAETTIEEASALDTKSKLQELVQGKGMPTPTYRIVKKEGPDHNRVFTAQVFIAKKPFGMGQGKSKQEAEQRAAKSSISMI